MSTTHIFICPGCNRASAVACAGEVAVFNGERHAYMLCPRCSSQLKRDPEKMMQKVELALARKGGRA